MMSDSIIEENKDDGYLETDRTGDDLDDENILSKGGGSSGKKYDMLDSSMDADSSIMIIEESICDDLDESGLLTNRSTHSPATSPRKTPISELNGGPQQANPNKIKLTNDMGQVRLTQKMRAKEKDLRKFLAVQRNRTLRQSEKQRMIADFVRYIEALVQLFRLSEKLDAAGDTIQRIFKICFENSQKSHPKALENFRNWVINFDVWGSFMPLTAQSWDIQLARAAAYEKLSIFRASLHDIVRQNQKLNKKLKK